MKKLILSVAVVAGTFGAALADGSCALGDAVMTPNPGGGYQLTCPFSGNTCFETGRNDPRKLQPGDKIVIHTSTGTVDAVVQSSSVNSAPSGHIGDVPAFKIQGAIEVSVLGS